MHGWLCRVFKKFPHPDEKQRAELSKQLGLEPRQIKFWFQNRRTQMKVSKRTHPAMYGMCLVRAIGAALDTGTRLSLHGDELE